MNWLALILSALPFAVQDDVPPNRVVGWVIPMPVAQDESQVIQGPITDAIARRLDAMQKAWAERETAVTKLLSEIEERQERRDQERFGFIKQWLENLRPGPVGPVDTGPVREFFAAWRADREEAVAERAEAAAERAAWREDRERWRRDSETAAGERKTLLDRMAENRAALIEARTAAMEARAEAAAAAAQAKASLQQTGPIRQGLQLLINLVWAVICLIVVVAVVYGISQGLLIWRSFAGVTL
jgi:DNA repair exonuclease SbcCD ATPase subunit